MLAITSCGKLTRKKIGRTYEARTRDPHIKSVLLYQLS